MTTVRASSNLKFDLSGPAFEAGLRKVLAENPDILALQEALEGNDRDRILTRVGKQLGYEWARAKGGEPIMWKASRYRLRAVHGVLLARAEFVGHIPGRKDRLPRNIATEVILDDLESPDRDVEVVIDYHLTAEVQDVKGGGGYKRDLLHLLRVMRHKREKRRLGRRMRKQQRKAREVTAAGDGNFSGMTIGGFVNCWEDHHGSPHGTLQGRPVDIIFADRKPRKLDTLQTPSDHDSLVCTYPE